MKVNRPYKKELSAYFDNELNDRDKEAMEKQNADKPGLKKQLKDYDKQKKLLQSIPPPFFVSFIH